MVFNICLNGETMDRREDGSENLLCTQPYRRFGAKDGWHESP